MLHAIYNISIHALSDMYTLCMPLGVGFSFAVLISALNYTVKSFINMALEYTANLNLF